MGHGMTGMAGVTGVTGALAAAGGAGDSGNTLLVLVGRVLLVAVAAVVIVVVAMWLKRRVFGGSDGVDALPVGGFGVSELRRMRDRGELTQDEFERARDRVVLAARRVTHEDDATPPAERPKGLDLLDR